MTSTPPTVPAAMEDLPRSGIREIMDQAWKLGEPITHLEVGEPGFSTPGHIVEAFCRAVRNGATRYTPNAGIEPLREACARKIRTYNEIAVDADQVLITVGAMQGLLAATIGLVESGDEILTPTPGWPNYQLLIALAGAHPVSYGLESKNGHQPDPGQIASLITKRTRMIILNSPSNPLGSIVGSDVIDEILGIAARHGIWVLSDECYDQIVFDGKPVSPAARPLGPDRTITVHSFSKTYAMTGFRLGYLSGPRRVVSLLTKLQESMVACVNTPSQHAGVEALSGPQDCVDEMVAEYRTRRGLAVERARELGMNPLSPAGAFYLWLEVPGLTDSLEFAEELLDQHRVAVAPGSAFGEPTRPALRLSLAASRESITVGLDAIARLANNHTAR